MSEIDYYLGMYGYPPEDYMAPYEDEYEGSERQSRRHKTAKRIKKEVRVKDNKKPLLIRCGKHYINPSDVRQITQVRDNLYVVKFMSEPNPDFACWVHADEIGFLLSHFDILVSD